MDRLPTSSPAATVTTVATTPPSTAVSLAVLRISSAPVPHWMGELTDQGNGTSALRVTGDSAQWLAVSLVMRDVQAELLEASVDVAAELAALHQRLGRLVRLDAPAFRR